MLTGVITDPLDIPDAPLAGAITGLSYPTDPEFLSSGTKLL
jgi:hypothetical protein